MIKVGTQDVAALRLGAQEIVKAYLGDEPVFNAVPGPAVYTITASIAPAGSGTVTGTGQYQEGASVTLTAVENDGYKFTGWQENGQTVSTDNPYTFTAVVDRVFTAVFEEKPASRLPAGYTEVEYVEMTSTATPASYVDTGFSMLLTHRYLLDVEFGDPASTSDQLYFGTDTKAGSNGTLQFYNYFTAAAIGIRYGYASSVTRYSIGSTKGRHTVEIDVKNRTLKFDSQSFPFAIPTAMQMPIRLYGPRYSTIKWHVVEFYKNDVLSAQLVPCTNSAGTPGFYDLVRKYFYTLTGTTGTITTGPAV